MIWRGLKWQWRRLCFCCYRKSRGIDSQQAVHKKQSQHYLSENRHPDGMAWYKKLLRFISRTCAEEPIQSDIDRAKMLNKKDKLSSLDDDDD